MERVIWRTPIQRLATPGEARVTFFTVELKQLAVAPRDAPMPIGLTADESAPPQGIRL
jgi:hypothetical protein